MLVFSEGNLKKPVMLKAKSLIIILSQYLNTLFELCILAIIGEQSEKL